VAHKHVTKFAMMHTAQQQNSKKEISLPRDVYA